MSRDALATRSPTSERTSTARAAEPRSTGVRVRGETADARAHEEDAAGVRLLRIGRVRSCGGDVELVERRTAERGLRHAGGRHLHDAAQRSARRVPAHSPAVPERDPDATLRVDDEA